MNQKFINKYMRLAKQIGEDENPCLSRQIGVIVVDPIGNKILGTGYNGPPKGTPHTDSAEYLQEIFWPQLTDEEKNTAYEVARQKMPDSSFLSSDLVCAAFVGCKTCPRKIVGAASGKRLELCSCAHAETNAIVNSSNDLNGAWMFCWCGVPCFECTKLIINAGIEKVFVIKWGVDYSHGSRWLFKKRGVEIVENPPEFYLKKESDEHKTE